MPGLIADLVRLKVDVLVIVSLSAIRAAKQATSAIPIVMVSAVDPVLTGLVDSLARPGRNVTGVTRLTRALSGKRLELLKEVLPGMSYYLSQLGREHVILERGRVAEKWISERWDSFFFSISKLDNRIAWLQIPVRRSRRLCAGNRNNSIRAGLRPCDKCSGPSWS